MRARKPDLIGARIAAYAAGRSAYRVHRLGGGKRMNPFESPLERRAFFDGYRDERKRALTLEQIELKLYERRYRIAQLERKAREEGAVAS